MYRNLCPFSITFISYRFYLSSIKTLKPRSTIQFINISIPQQVLFFIIHNQSMALRRRTLLKVLVLGDSRVGKTSVINQYVQKKFEKEYKGTIGADFFTKELKIGDQLVTLQIWDTAGRERFQSRGVSFYRGSDGCVLIYDVNHMKSFDALTKWHAEFVQKGTPRDSTTPPIILLGNKVDVDGGSSRVVSVEKARAWCATRGNIPYFETSARMDVNLDAAFLSIARSVLGNEREDIYSPPFPEPAPPVNIQRVGCASWCTFFSDALAKILRILSGRRT